MKRVNKRYPDQRLPKIILSLRSSKTIEMACGKFYIMTISGVTNEYYSIYGVKYRERSGL